MLNKFVSLLAKAAASEATKRVVIPAAKWAFKEIYNNPLVREAARQQFDQKCEDLASRFTVVKGGKGEDEEECADVAESASAHCENADSEEEAASAAAQAPPVCPECAQPLPDER